MLSRLITNTNVSNKLEPAVRTTCPNPIVTFCQRVSVLARLQTWCPQRLHSERVMRHVRPPLVRSTCCVSAGDFVSAHGGG